jgi:hypothetical protein
MDTPGLGGGRLFGALGSRTMGTGTDFLRKSVPVPIVPQGGGGGLFGAERLGGVEAGG